MVNKQSFDVLQKKFTELKLDVRYWIKVGFKLEYSLNEGIKIQHGYIRVKKDESDCWYKGDNYCYLNKWYPK